MDDQDLYSIIRGEIETAVNYSDSEFAARRIQQMDYYLGEPLGNEQDGKSKVISTEVCDTIELMVPQLVRIFAGTDKTVKFEPRGPEDVKAAEQATDYVNYILHQKNPGFRIIHDMIKDSLISGLGVVKVYWQEEETVTEDLYQGLSDDELTLLLDDPNIEIIEQDEREVGDPETMPDGSVLPPVTVFDVRVKRTKEGGSVKIENVPPEEFLFNQRAKSLDDCRFVAHRTTMSVSDLVSMGFDQDMVEGYAGFNDTDFFDEKQTRFQDLESAANDEAKAPSEREVLVTEVYIKVDFDGDGISEMRRVLCLGSAYEIVENESHDMFPFAVMSPVLMPHRLVGRSVAELLTDLQESKTAILRSILDSIYATNHARVAVVDGMVNLDDLTSARPGGVVRMRQPGMVQPLTPPPIHDSAFPLLSYMDEVREMRTGMSKQSAGLDPKVLQSTTAAAVAAQVRASQAKVELVARVFAETGIRDMMRCILKTVLQHVTQPEVMRLRNEFHVIDPNEWSDQYDINIEVGLGFGDDQNKLAVLTQISQKQEEILTKMGIDNPLCTLAQYRDTLGKMLSASGFKNVNDFFLDPENLPAELQQKIQQKMQQASGAGQNPMLEIEKQRLEAERQKIQAEIQLDREKMQAELQLKREMELEELKMKFELRKQEMAYEAQLRAAEAMSGANISTNIPRA